MSDAATLQAPSRASRPDVAIPSTFEGFLGFLGVKLEGGQRLVVRVAYDRVPVEQLDLDERALLALIAPGLTDDVAPGARDVVVLVCGGRSGKSYVLVSLRLLHGALTRDLSTLAPGQRAVAPVVAPNDDLRQEVINYALGAMRSRPELQAMLRLPKGTRPDDTVSEFEIERPDGQRVLVTGAVATKGGYGGRGRALTDAFLDECAFFRDRNAVVNDQDIFSAMSPRVLPGGQTICASTPWAKAGLLYDLHARNHAFAVDAVSFQASTLQLRDAPLTRVIVERETRRDPDNAAREFGAVFPSSGTLQFFDADLVESCLVADVPPWQPGDEMTAGADFGFRSDSSACVLAWRRAGVVYVGTPLELRPAPGQPLRPSTTVTAFAEAIAGRCPYLMADGHYRESIDEHLSAHRLAYAPAPAQVAEPYVRLRTLMRDGRVKIVRHERMVQQLREVVSRPLPGGAVSIVHPRWRTGGHGDLVAALVLATWQHGGAVVPEAPKPKTPDAFDERQKAHLADLARPAWQRPGRGADAPWKR